MRWYMIRTWAGGEEGLVKEIRRTVPPYLYQDVFIIYNERIWRHQGRSVFRAEPLFRGCVFLTCTETEALFRRLTQIPSMAHLLAVGTMSVFPLREQDVRFLEAISGEDHKVPVSYVLRESEADTTYRVYGPLEYLLEGIERIKFRTRTAKTHKALWGEDMVLPLGILAKEDVGEKILYQGRETIVQPPSAGRYSMLEIEKDAGGKNVYVAGKKVVLLSKEHIDPRISSEGSLQAIG